MKTSYRPLQLPLPIAHFSLYILFMKIFVSLLLALVVAFTISAQQQVKSPAEIYGGLFTDVQMHAVFPDSKTFPDCVPKRDPTEIVKDYVAMKKKPWFKTQEFLNAKFYLPEKTKLK